jgi:hypothetical protein
MEKGAFLGWWWWEGREALIEREGGENKPTERVVGVVPATTTRPCGPRALFPPLGGDGLAAAAAPAVAINLFVSSSCRSYYYVWALSLSRLFKLL